MAKNSIERLGGEYDLESRLPAFSAHLSRSQQINSPNIYKCGIILVLEGVVFFSDYLFCCNNTRGPDI